MKKGVLGILVFLISLCFVAQAFALNAGSRVTIAPNGEGDLLIFPAYFTGGGWESEVTLINTSQNASIVVHVAVRRASDSKERDFLVFLSPTDVFRMIIKQNAQGVPVVETSDSSLALRNDCYSAADYAADHDGQPYEVQLGAGWEIGYIAAVVVAESNQGTPPVKKKTICGDYIRIIGKFLPVAGTPPTIPTWNIPSNNVLTGSIEIYNNQNNVRGAIKAFALKDYKNTYAPGWGETLDIGFNANNSQIEVDAVLANDKVVVPYVTKEKGWTLFTATFPSCSGAYIGRTARYDAYDTEEHMGAFSPPPTLDNFQEMSTYLIDPDSTWGEPLNNGWALIDYGGTIAARPALGGALVTVTDGVPAIHTVIHTLLDKEGKKILGMGWFYAPSKMGKILYGTNVVSHYAPVTIPAVLCPGAFCNY